MAYNKTIWIERACAKQDLIDFIRDEYMTSDEWKDCRKKFEEKYNEKQIENKK